MSIIEGSSVVVQISNREAYAMGCAEVLHGACGVVSRIREGQGFDPKNVLVEFDAPLPSWWGNGSPVEAFWFQVDELQPVGLS